MTTTDEIRHDQPLNGDVSRPPEGISSALLWDALLLDAQCCVVLMDANGNVSATNCDGGGGCGYSGCPLKAPRNVSDSLPKDQAAQLLSCTDRVIKTRSPIVIIWYLDGVRSRTVLRFAGTDNEPLVLLTTRTARGARFDEEHPNGAEVIHSKAGDRGPLASLTERELRVLEFIGRGYSTARIAETLDRSTKTIEWHRASIGKKLKVSNRVELARIAISTGLSTL